MAALIWKFHDSRVSGVANGFRWMYDKFLRRQKPAVDLGPQQSEHALVDSSKLEDGTGVEDGKQNLTSTTSDLSSRIEAQGEPKRTWYQLVRDLAVSLYKACSTPLNQNNQGVGDEVRNFFRWCKDPQRVSRKVIRHPIRERDSQTVKVRAGPEQAEQEEFTPGQQSSFFRGASVRRPHHAG